LFEVAFLHFGVRLGKSLYSLLVLGSYMADERLIQVRERLISIERKLRPLEWDANRNQINDYKKQELENLRLEQTTLQEELKGLPQ